MFSNKSAVNVSGPTLFGKTAILNLYTTTLRDEQKIQNNLFNFINKIHLQIFAQRT